MSRIVIIEDNPDVARLAEKLLRNAGHIVIVAPDGETGLTTTFEQMPDLVLMDLGLPDIEGQTVVGLLKQQESTSHIPVIAFTAWPQETAYSMAQAYGCDGVIVKPIDTRLFAKQVAEFLEARNER